MQDPSPVNSMKTLESQHKRDTRPLDFCCKATSKATSKHIGTLKKVNSDSNPPHLNPRTSPPYTPHLTPLCTTQPLLPISCLPVVRAPPTSRRPQAGQRLPRRPRWQTDRGFHEKKVLIVLLGIQRTLMIVLGMISGPDWW